MNAVERIEAAIQKLEQLRDSSWPGAWVYDNETIIAGEGFKLFQHHPDERLTNPALTLSGDEPLAQAELIVTLHRTIDAQLGVLREALDSSKYYGPREWDSEFAEVYAEHIALADSILGDAS